MALVPTLLAIGLGVALGVYWGGRVQNVLAWRPTLWPLGAGSVAVIVLLDVLPLHGGFVRFVWLCALAALVAFCAMNIRVGGMVLVVAGLGLNLLVSLLNFGMPVSGSALVSAGLVEESELATVSLSGGRILADGALLGFLGDAIALPWGHVVSIGDLLVLVGLVLVTASVVRRYEVGGRGHLGGDGGPRDYRNALDALGRGPAPRHGPGLHPSRLPGEQRPRRPGSGPR